MQIDIALFAQRVSNVIPIGDWICGVLASASGLPDPALMAAQATRPWLTQVAVIHEQDALVDFVNLNREDTGQIVGFIQKYGLFSNGDVAGMSSYPGEVEAYWTKAQKAGRTPFATDLASFRFFHARLSSMSKLSRSQGLRQRDAAFQEFAYINQGFCNRIRRMYPRDFENRLLSYYVSQGLASVALGLTPYRSKMVAAIIVPDVRSALYVALLSNIVRGTVLKKCGRKACTKVFVTTRPDKEYCSEYCQNLEKVNRYRRRLKRKTGDQKT